MEDVLLKGDLKCGFSPPQFLQLLVVSFIHPLDIVHMKEENLKGTRHPPLLLHGAPHLPREKELQHGEGEEGTDVRVP